MEPPYVPVYQKPDIPGLAMNFDNTVSLYHIVEPEDSFEQAVQAVFHLLQTAQERFPNWPRTFYLEVRGHRGERYGFDDDFFEFQQEFWFSTIAHFVTAFETPLTGALVNPNPQRNDLPDRLVVGPPDGLSPSK